VLVAQKCGLQLLKKQVQANPPEKCGAQERTRTFTSLRILAPEASASTNFTTWAGSQNVPEIENDEAAWARKIEPAGGESHFREQVLKRQFVAYNERRE
jgi:hypothetical protein